MQNIVLPKIILSPLSGISCLPFRTLNRKFGCDLAFVEMINARSLAYLNKQTQEMLSTNSIDKPLGIQLVGNQPKYVLEATNILKSYACDILDFNAACPQKKVVSKGDGAALLKLLKRLLNY